MENTRTVTLMEKIITVMEQLGAVEQGSCAGIVATIHQGSQMLIIMEGIGVLDAEEKCLNIQQASSVLQKATADPLTKEKTSAVGSGWINYQGCVLLLASKMDYRARQLASLLCAICLRHENNVRPHLVRKFAQQALVTLLSEKEKGSDEEKNPYLQGDKRRGSVFLQRLLDLVICPDPAAEQEKSMLDKEPMVA